MTGPFGSVILIRLLKTGFLFVVLERRILGHWQPTSVTLVHANLTDLQLLEIQFGGLPVEVIGL
jgi:hypothetical protein